MKSDVSIAKNYLNKTHIKELNRIVSDYLDLTESRAEHGVLMKMEDWIQFLHNFFELSIYPILQDKDYLLDFAKEVKRISGCKL